MAQAAEGERYTASFWNDAGGRAWVELQDLLERLNAPIGEAVVSGAFPGPGGRVLDVGCGSGATTLEMARRLGPSGRSVGIDVSGPLLEAARRQATADGVQGVEFVQADAQTHDFGPGAFDAVMSRYGVMFFADPDAAFGNLRRALKPDGRLVFACWRGPEENPISQETLAAARPFLGEMPPMAKDGGGRFAFADPARVRGILERSGWREIDIAPLDAPTPLSFDEAMRLSLELGVLGPLLGQASEEVRAKVREAVAEALKAHLRDGMVRMTAACWLVTARP